jgi:nitronate monooxygenase
MSPFRTPLCDLLGSEHPIVQSGMGKVAGPELAAEVSRAGGLGILAGFLAEPEALRSAIRRVRELTDRPFGVNQWLHTELSPPVDPETLPQGRIAEVQRVLNGFRARLGLPEAQARPPRLPDVTEAVFEVILDERVPVWSIGLGNPTAEQVARCHERGMKVVAMVATVEDARAVAARGVDAIVAQGAEAGGHRSTWVKRGRDEACVGTLALVPQVVDAVEVPVIAAGGITNGRGLLAALALGASGVLLGTRFVATRESTAPAFYKQQLIERDADATVLSDAVTGLWARLLRNEFIDEYGRSGAPVLPGLLQAVAATDVFSRAAEAGDPRFFPMYAGQSNGLMRDLPGAGEVVRRLVGEAEAAFAALAGESVRARGG